MTKRRVRRADGRRIRRAAPNGGMAAALALLLAACSMSDDAGSQAPPSGKTADASYLCPDGTVIHARYYVEADSVDLRVGDEALSVRLPIAMSASGARYTDGAYEIWEHQGEARVSLPDGTVHEACAKQP